MKVLRNINVLKKAISSISNLGFVPTMGSLHNGHVSLIKKSQLKCKKTLVSIYINPKQFNKKNDFSLYPRNTKKDLNLLKKLKVDFVFMPKTKDIYSIKASGKIKLLNSQKILCAKNRKGHFEGVLKIMDRFIMLIKPKYVFMGEKDYQQILLVKNWIKNKYKSKIYACKTIRDKNNVALSSRNYLLDKNELNKASQLITILIRTKRLLQNKNYKKKYLSQLKDKLINNLKIQIEYLEIRNKHDLKISRLKKKSRLFIAYYINNVRLIDNL
jgi:pantoate--beta-alanine ligase